MITDHEKRVVAWHEAGHALVSELLPTVDKVQKVSIVPRGKALGYTLNLPQEDRYLKSREELIDYMKVLLAGRVSEQITFGRVTTGASDDLKRVTAIARSMVHEYGMGTTIRSHQVPSDDLTVSEFLRQTRDEEIQAISEEAYRGAHELLTDHRDLLDEIAERLLANEVIEHDEIAAIMAAKRDRTEQPTHAARRRPGRAPGARRSPSRPEPPLTNLRPGVRADRSRRRRRRGPRRSAGACTRATFGMPVAHRETVDEQGVEAVLLDVGEAHVELLRPLGPGDAGREVPRPQGARAAPRRLPRRRHRGGARAAATSAGSS